MSLELYSALADVTDGKMLLRDMDAFLRAMQDFPDGIVSVTVEVTTEKALRSLQANRFMWSIFTLIGDEMGGTSKEDVHDLMCEQFLTRTIDVIDKQTGETTSHRVTCGTSRLSRKEHAAFVDQVLLWAAEFLGMTLPKPRGCGVMAIDTSMLKFGKPKPRVVERRDKRVTKAAIELTARIAVNKRDKGKCVVPGCKERSQHLHHIVYRSRGGKWSTENLCSLCPGHHGLVHSGKITIAGNADEHLTITGDAKYLRFKL